MWDIFRFGFILTNVIMDYQPRYAQPFTLREATALDIPIITEGIHAGTHKLLGCF